MSLRDYDELKKLTDRISKAITCGNISHAYIIEADSLINKEQFAKDIIKAVLCTENIGVGCDSCITCRKIEHDNYSDLYIVRGDENSLKDAEIVKLQENLKSKPSDGNRNLAIICDADSMTVRAQNRLLKTLEEPSPGTIIFLLVSNTDNLLQTITSRCIIYRPGNYIIDSNVSELEVPRTVMDMVLEGAYFHEIKDFLTKKVKDRKAAFNLLDGLERLYREYLVSSGHPPIREEKVIENVRYVEEARRDLLANVNYKYAIRNLILKIGG